MVGSGGENGKRSTIKSLYFKEDDLMKVDRSKQRWDRKKW